MQQPSSKVSDAENKEIIVEDVEMAQQTSIEEVLPENTEVMEPILVENPNRFVLFPIEHDDIWAEYKKQEGGGDHDAPSIVV